ncbi:hypothetical protein [Carboxylicivirga sp. M1479]|uniref:hypothetical protein n=1 Tax=Carboxylicivirga sp. M1479 TaxID=2594476 RepID=UPI0011782EF1|nr:hypothetical protein [Carboxylicivirga sp. M1479]TRX72529.1 hypothetical protein FNN09_00900 [Carboxylicivirga sp. M1479]
MKLFKSKSGSFIKVLLVGLCFTFSIALFAQEEKVDSCRIVETEKAKVEEKRQKPELKKTLKGKKKDDRDANRNIASIENDFIIKRHSISQL